MTIEELFGTLQQAVVATWRKHLKTYKYSKHMALDEFYKELPEKVDALIEAWMGAKGKKINSFTNIITSKNMGTLVYLKELRKVVKQGYELMGGDAELEALMDDIVELIDSTLYKVKELSENKVMNLKDFINESLGMVNKAMDKPRGKYTVVSPMPTDSCWEYYAYANKDNSQIDLEEMEDMYRSAEFANFLKYAQKKRWKKDKNDYYIIPKKTTLEYVDYITSAPHIGLFEINGDGVYIPLDHDSVEYGDYDKYLEYVAEEESDEWEGWD